MSRWVRLNATSRSGKTLFCCLDCGRVSPTPDKRCAGQQPYSGKQATCGDEDTDTVSMRAPAYEGEVRTRISMGCDELPLTEFKVGDGEWQPFTGKVPVAPPGTHVLFRSPASDS